MQKTVPSPARLAIMAAFALSCFGLLVFLWLSFGGSVPLKPKGYRFQVAFAEASQLVTEADVRIAGVPVGKVRRIERDPRGDRTLATIEIDSRFAPIPADSRATLRQKTLLGETFIEMTHGSDSGPRLPEGGRLADAQVAPTVEFDEILGLFDADTRTAFRTWQQDLGRGVRDQGLPINDAIGNLPGFFEHGTDVLTVLDRNEDALGRLVRDTGTVFEALTEREDKLRELVTNTREVFDETAARGERLAETIAIFPTFLDESRLTFERTEQFARDARPVIRLLRGPTQDLGPTFTDLRSLSPDLVRALRGIDALTEASRLGFPALSQILDNLRPVLTQLNPFLSQLNPILQYFEANQYGLSDFLGGDGAVGLAPTAQTATEGAIGHYLRQVQVTGAETAALYTQRLPSNRGNAYRTGTQRVGPRPSQFAINPSFDCRNAGGEKLPTDGPTGSPGCIVATPLEFQEAATSFPVLRPDMP